MLRLEAHEKATAAYFNTFPVIGLWTKVDALTFLSSSFSPNQESWFGATEAPLDEISLPISADLLVGQTSVHQVATDILLTLRLTDS